MTIVIPEWVLSLGAGVLMIAAVMFVLIVIGGLIAGYFYSREMSRLDNYKKPATGPNSDEAMVARARELIAAFEKLPK